MGVGVIWFDGVDLEIIVFFDDMLCIELIVLGGFCGGYVKEVLIVNFFNGWYVEFIDWLGNLVSI